jgi:hypothetical protein
MTNLIYKISNPNCSSCNNNKNTSRSLNVDKSPYLTFAIPDSTNPQALNLGVTKWLGISFIAMGELTYKNNNERVYIQPIIFPEKDFLYMNGNELGI